MLTQEQIAELNAETAELVPALFEATDRTDRALDEMKASVPTDFNDLSLRELFDRFDEFVATRPYLQEPVSVPATCGNCKSFDRGICKLRASADWGDAAHVKNDRYACSFADLWEF